MPAENKDKINEMIASAKEISDPAERSRRYKIVSGVLSREAVRSNDPRLIEEAVKIAGLVTDDAPKAYVEIIRAIAKLRTKDKSTFDEAIRITGKIDRDLDISVALYEISTAFGIYGLDKMDEALYSQCLALVSRIPLDTYRSMALRNISKRLTSTDTDKALELLDASIEIIEKSKGIKNIYLVPAFCETAALLAMLNDKRSYGFLKKSIALAEDIQDEFEISAVMLKIMETEIQIAAMLKDEQIQDEASIISKEIRKEYYKTLASNY